MGRSLAIAGTDMVVIYERTDEDRGPIAELWDVSDELNPTIRRTWSLACSPIAVTMRKNYDHFFISCTNGPIYIGTLTEDRAASRLKRIRNYGFSSLARRALHIDPARELLLAFPTKLDVQTLFDVLYEDAKTYDENANETRQSAGTDENGNEIFESIRNEIPDTFESTLRAQASPGRHLPYQFAVYDIAAERDAAPDCTVTEDEDCVFPSRNRGDPVVKNELRWLYFQVRNFDGSPDLINPSPTARYYRTNFWDATPDPDDPDAFYLSHRGPPLEEINKGSPYANHVVRVRIEGDLRPGEDGPPLTEDVLSFERVYGFKGENNDHHYPGDIEVGYIDGQKVLVTNHFRDLDNWVRDDVYFSIAVKLLDTNLWWEETPNNFEPLESYYQFAMNDDGVIVSPSFYGNQVMALDVKPGVGISVRRIK